jgi:hypothetical protein
MARGRLASGQLLQWRPLRRIRWLRACSETSVASNELQNRKEASGPHVKLSADTVCVSATAVCSAPFSSTNDRRRLACSAGREPRSITV